jgi:SAM-dependent methyltransferase
MDMAFYNDRVVPHLVNFCCGMKNVRPMRERVCAGLSGRVVELGFGTGHNVPFYPPAVTSVAAVEPSDVSWRLAGKRLAKSSTAVTRSGLDGQSLPFDDASFDAALITYSLCTIPDAVAALYETRRVLAPGARLYFLEHGLAPDAGVQKWQRRLEPVQKRVAGGCHLTRSVPDLLDKGGFEVLELDQFYEPGAPKAVGALSLGVAVAR